MNAVTELFLNHLKHSPAVGAANQFAADLQNCEGDPQGIMAATFQYMRAIQQELTTFIQQVDVVSAAIRLQD